MLQEITVCASWKTDVIRLTKEAEKQSTRRIAGGNSLHYSSVALPPPGMDCSQPFQATHNVEFPSQTSSMCMLITFHRGVSLPGALVIGMLRTRVDRNRAPHSCVDLWVSGGSGVRCFVVRFVCGTGLGVQTCQMTLHMPWPVLDDRARTE